MAGLTQNSAGNLFNEATSSEYGETTKGVRMKVEKNSKGYNWTASVYGETVEEAWDRLIEATARLSRTYGA